MDAYDGGDVDDVLGAGDGWDLFGPSSLDGLAGMVGDGGDAAYARGVDYTAVLRAAKSSEREVRRALGRVMPPDTRVVTQAWSTAQGEPVVLVELSAEAWCRWARFAEGSAEWLAGSHRHGVRNVMTVRDTVRELRRLRLSATGQQPVAVAEPGDFWSRCPAAVMVDLVSVYQGK